ncbi:MAG: peptidoglycan-binding protein [Acidimicrobiia bacterium]|nr:peptidoglycan-binding protein [Acidimicrobiia bacterium]
MRKALALTLSLGLFFAACGDGSTLATETSAGTSSTTEAAAATTETTDGGSVETTATTDPGPPAPDPGTLAALTEGEVEDPLMGSGWHSLEWGDDAYTVLESPRSTTGDAEFLDLLDVVAWEPAPATTGLAPDQVLVHAFIAFPSMDIPPHALVVYSPGGQGWEPALVLDDLSIETALLETTDYVAAAPAGPALVDFNPTSLDMTTFTFIGMVRVLELDSYETAYEGEISCDFSAAVLVCITLTDDGVLRPGDEGEDVEALQQDLADLGYLTGNVDGKYGPGTAAAVRAFQTDYLLTRDGKAGEQTRALLADVVGGVSQLVLASKSGIGSWAFGTGSDTAYAGLIAALGVPDSTTGWYQDGCDGHDWFKASWDGFSIVFTDRNGTRQLDGWEVNDLSDLPDNLLIAGGIHGGTKWGALDAMGANFYDDYLGQRWRIPALSYGNGRFVNTVSNPPGAGSAIASFGTGTGGFESC